MAKPSAGVGAGVGLGPADMYTPPGMPPVSMRPQDIGQPPGNWRYGQEDQPIDAYMDPAQEVGMAYYRLNQAHQEKSRTGIKYWSDHINQLLKMSNDQTRRLIEHYQRGSPVAPDTTPSSVLDGTGD